ncbi:MAG: addiction module protein [Polyangiaceae bacterium]|nr:addiction module protein [Polyangiaceae bacterium]
MAPTRRPRIVWASPALDELDEVAAWISRDDPAAAARPVRRVCAGLERLGVHPRLGRYVHEAPPAERAALAVRLLDSIAAPGDDVAAAQRAESRARLAAARDGAIDVVDDDDAMRMIEG